MEEKNQGVILFETTYLDRQKILKVFTKEAGLVSFFVKSAKLLPFCSPFCIAEWMYRKSDKDLFRLLDVTLLNPLTHLRNSYESLLAAGSMANDLLRSQFPLKPSPLLYELLIAYLQRIEITPPEVLAISFRLKLLLHDGSLCLAPFCSLCKAQSTILFQGQSYCSEHRIIGGHSFPPEEWDLLLKLTYTRQFKDLDNLSLSDTFAEKTAKIFEEITR